LTDYFDCGVINKHRLYLIKIVAHKEAHSNDIFDGIPISNLKLLPTQDIFEKFKNSLNFTTQQIDMITDVTITQKQNFPKVLQN